MATYVSTNGSNVVSSSRDKAPAKMMAFRDFVREATQSGQCADSSPTDWSNCTFYGVRTSLASMPKQGHQMQLPTFMRGLQLIHISSGLWFAQRHARVPPHVDGFSHRFMSQINGSKRVVLMPPGFKHESSNTKPMVAKSFLLRAGEMLYLPPCWLHQVYYIDFSWTMILRLAKNESVRYLDEISCAKPIELTST